MAWTGLEIKSPVDLGQLKTARERSVPKFSILHSTS